MICRFEHSGLCCNSGSRHYEYECKKCECMIPISNAERIRSMTDEELSVFLHTSFSCYGCPARIVCGSADLDCDDIVFDWLKQPYGGDT
jgi:hypothetical protein